MVFASPLFFFYCCKVSLSYIPIMIWNGII